jgi:thymidylate kinase
LGLLVSVALVSPLAAVKLPLRKPAAVRWFHARSSSCAKAGAVALFSMRPLPLPFWLTLLMLVPQELTEKRRLVRQPTLPLHLQRDRIEEAGHAFFERVAKGYQAIAAAEPQRVRKIDATGTVAELQEIIWNLVEPVVRKKGKT